MEVESEGEAPAQSMARENEIRITSSGKEMHYISYAMSLFERGHNTAILTAMGGAINKSISVCEILKRRIPGLHQWNSIESRGQEDKSGDNGKDSNSRMVSYMTITLSTDQDILARTDALGYQPPIAVSGEQTMWDGNGRKGGAGGNYADRRKRHGRGRGGKSPGANTNPDPT